MQTILSASDGNLYHLVKIADKILEVVPSNNSTFIQFVQKDTFLEQRKAFFKQLQQLTSIVCESRPRNKTPNWN